uniref:Leucine-rich repeat-containing N-terminal plant-type domain-containing protein n=1 Tax=Chenopodium quinoa TaxID=63459 RepID=A0A803MSN5_CHEQI
MMGCCWRKAVVYILMIWLQQCCFQSVAILDPLDFLALQSIRKSLRDVPGSNFFQSWDFTSDPCNFPGVYCDSDKVIALNLGDPRSGSPGLTGRIDPAIGKLSSLAENFLTGDIPAGFGELRSLHTLDLSYNQLTGSIPRPLGSLPVLSNLILCHNHLDGPLPSFISNSLTRVDLMHNNLTGPLQSDSFPPSVQYLSLGWNKLIGPVFTTLPKLNRLNYLDLSMNHFTGLIPCQIFTFPISNLQLQRNQFFGPVQPDSQVTIATIDLSYNRLSGQVSPMLSTVQNLFLNNNRFFGSVPESFVDRLMDATIQTLYLQHNYLTGFQMNQTAEIPLSSVLCLQYNCMVPPTQSACPLKAGDAKTRPTAQCNEWRG